MGLKTFTTDCLLGKPNPEFEHLINIKYANKAEELIRQWVNECCELNIEADSAWGAFFQMLFTKYAYVTTDIELKGILALKEEM